MPASPAQSSVRDTCSLLLPGVRPRRRHGEWVWMGLMNSIISPRWFFWRESFKYNEADMGRAKGRDSAVTLIQGRLPDPPLRPWLGEERIAVEASRTPGMGVLLGVQVPCFPT